jgi:hypothetical protein
MTEEEQWYYDQLDEENKQNVDMVLNELKTYTKNDQLSLLSALDLNDVENFLHDNDINIYKEYKSELKTVFSIAKYIMLYATEKNTINKLDEYLKKNNVNNELNYTILRGFKSELLFNVKNKGELKTKYIYDIENDKFNFYLIGHNNNFLINFVDLKMLILGKPTINMPSDISNKSEDELTLIFNGMKINIKKQ